MVTVDWYLMIVGGGISTCNGESNEYSDEIASEKHAARVSERHRSVSISSVNVALNCDNISATTTTLTSGGRDRGSSPEEYRTINVHVAAAAKQMYGVILNV